MGRRMITFGKSSSSQVYWLATPRAYRKWKTLIEDGVGDLYHDIKNEAFLCAWSYVEFNEMRGLFTGDTIWFAQTVVMRFKHARRSENYKVYRWKRLEEKLRKRKSLSLKIITGHTWMDRWLWVLLSSCGWNSCVNQKVQHSESFRWSGARKTNYKNSLCLAVTVVAMTFR